MASDEIVVGPGGAIAAEVDHHPRSRGLGARLGPLAERYGLVLVWGVEVVVFALIAPNFLTVRTFQIIFGSQSTLLVLSLAVVMALKVGEFDLSIANVLAFASSLTAFLTVVHGVPILLSVVVVLALGTLFGLVNGLLVVRMGIPSIIVTLGSGTFLAGVTLGWTGVGVIGGLPAGFVNFFSDRLLGLPYAFYYALAMCALLYYVFEHTPTGRQLLFTGHGENVARLAGIRVDRLRLASLVAAALLATIAGFTIVGLLGAADPAVSSSFLLPSFAAAFLGSTAIRPGEYNVWGTFVAVYFLVTGITGLQLLGYSGWVGQVFYGAALLVAVILTRLAGRSRSER